MDGFYDWDWEDLEVTDYGDMDQNLWDLENQITASKTINNINIYKLNIDDVLVNKITGAKIKITSLSEDRKYIQAVNLDDQWNYWHIAPVNYNINQIIDHFKLEADLKRKECDCGAKHTSFPEHHLGWCSLENK
jgi:hypothetical protein